MLINDLSYCEVVEENVVGGSGFGFKKNIDLTQNVNIDFDTDVDLDIDKNVDIDANSNVNVTGNFGNFTGEVTIAGEDGFGELDGSLFISDDLVEITLVGTGGVS